MASMFNLSCAFNVTCNYMTHIAMAIINLMFNLIFITIILGRSLTFIWSYKYYTCWKHKRSNDLVFIWNPLKLQLPSIFKKKKNPSIISCLCVFYHDLCILLYYSFHFVLYLNYIIMLVNYGVPFDTRYAFKIWHPRLFHMIFQALL